MVEDLRKFIRERYQRTLAQIADAAVGCGRDPGTVRLVVVTKSQPLEVVRAAVAVGISIFGENYAEEAVEKITALREFAIEWHMIGHVQSRKADLVVANFFMMHSLDNLKLAGRLNRSCSELKRRLPVLLEFNVSGEASKYGFPACEETGWPSLADEIEELLNLPFLHVCGLMTMSPFFLDPERTRPYFQRLRHLREFLAKQYPKVEWKDLSMGTSSDFVIAIQEGATIVRIGQAIFGPRV